MARSASGSCTPRTGTSGRRSERRVAEHAARIAVLGAHAAQERADRRRARLGGAGESKARGARPAAAAAQLQRPFQRGELDVDLAAAAAHARQVRAELEILRPGKPDAAPFDLREPEQGIAL